MSELAKDSHVEVYSKEDDHRGVWYNGILLDNPIDLPHAKLYHVRYNTPKASYDLMEVDEDHIRPVPPKDLYEDVVLEEGMMVEAEYRQGWWTGLLIKKMDKYLVFFGNHLGILEFDCKLVRPHLHWTGSKWEFDKNWATALEIDKTIRVVTPRVTQIDETCTGSNAEINCTNENGCVDGVRPLSPLIGNSSPEPSSDQSLNVVYNASVATDVNETLTKDKLMALPFVKTSTFWKKYETKEEYSVLPQSPHFSPLVEAKEDHRELLAIGLMVTFHELLEDVQDLQPDVSSSKLSSLSSSFAKLEKHGFDVEMPQARIGKLVSLKDGLAKETEKIKCVEKKLEVKKSKRQKLEEEILELKRREAVAIEKKDKMIVELKSSAETIYREIENMELEFNTTVSAQW